MSEGYLDGGDLIHKRSTSSAGKRKRHIPPASGAQAEAVVGKRVRYVLPVLVDFHIQIIDQVRPTLSKVTIPGLRGVIRADDRHRQARRGERCILFPESKLSEL